MLWSPGGAEAKTFLITRWHYLNFCIKKYLLLLLPNCQQANYYKYEYD